MYPVDLFEEIEDKEAMGRRLEKMETDGEVTYGREAEEKWSLEWETNGKWSMEGRLMEVRLISRITVAHAL